MTEQWETVEEISAARERFISALPDWRLPAAYAVGVIDSEGTVEFARVNEGEHPLPAVVLATVCGYRGETGAYPMTKEDLERAVELLAPAEACTAYQHPNLWAWRELLHRLDGDRRTAAVFVSDWDDESGDDSFVTALRAALGR